MGGALGGGGLGWWTELLRGARVVGGALSGTWAGLSGGG